MTFVTKPMLTTLAPEGRPRTHHDKAHGVVREVALECGGELDDRGEVREVEVQDERGATCRAGPRGGAERRDHQGAGAHVAHSENDVYTARQQLLRRGAAEARRGPRHDSEGRARRHGADEKSSGSGCPTGKLRSELKKCAGGGVCDTVMFSEPRSGAWSVVLCGMRRRA